MDQAKTVELESKSDVELMALLAKRDSDAMQEIYKRYESTLRTVIQSVLHEGGETDDALNDVFLQLWDHADRFVAEKGLHGFLVTMARRRALDRLRRRLAYRRATDRLETEMKAEVQNDERARDFSQPCSRQVHDDLGSSKGDADSGFDVPGEAAHPDADADGKDVQAERNGDDEDLD